MENVTHIITGCIRHEYKFQKLLYENYLGYSLKIVFRYIYRYEKAIDVVHDGFVKLFNSFQDFHMGFDSDNEKLLFARLKKIMVNTSIDELRKELLTPEIGGIPNQVWENTDKNDDADQVMLYNELITLIKELPPAYRIVFNLYVIDGYSHNEISALMDIPVGTSKSNLSRARILLQRRIKTLEIVKSCRI